MAKDSNISETKNIFDITKGDPTQMYLREIGYKPVLDQEEELKLFTYYVNHSCDQKLW